MLSAIYSILSDVVPESNRYVPRLLPLSHHLTRCRSISFMRIHVTSMVGNLISPALASAMMSSTGPWPVMLLTFILYIIAAVSIVLIPETLSHRSDPSGDPESRHATFKSRALQGLNQLKDSLSIVRIRSIALILCICIVSLPVILCTFQFMVQFISKRYHIPLAETGYVQSLYGISHIVVVLLIIPFISALIVRPSLPRWLRVSDEKRRDLVLVRWSYAAYVAGPLILAVSPSLPVFVVGLVVMSLGSGSASFIKSIATSHVDPEHRSRLFTLMALVEMASSIWAMPALAGLFSLGMRLGGEWIGLPYLGVSFTCLIMLVLALFVQTPAGDRGDEESTPEQDSGAEHT